MVEQEGRSMASCKDSTSDAQGDCGHGVCRCGQREEEKWVSSIPITHQNISTSTHFMMGDCDLISANKSRPYGFECTI